MRSLVIALSAALAGCAGVRKDIPSEAKIPVAAQWRTPTAEAPAVTATWWTSFGDATLNDLVAEALLHSDDIALAATRVEQARAQFHFAHAQRLPAVGLSVVGGRDRSVNPGFGVPEEQTAGEGVVEASFDTDLFGRLKASSEAARSGLLASEYARDTVRLGVTSSVVSGYVTLLALDARLGIVKHTAEIRRNELHVVQRRFDAGYSGRLELAQAQAELAATEQLIPATELAIARQEDGLSILVGRLPGNIVRGASFEGLQLPQIPAALPSTVLRARPDLAAAEAKLAATDHSLDAARAAFLPDVQLAASIGQARSNIIPESPIGIWSIGGSILAPIFEAGRLEAQRDAVTAQRDEAAFAYRKSALQAFREVEDGLAAVVRDAEQDDALVREHEAVDRALHLSTQRYREGYANYLDQLDAQRNLLSVELALVQSRLDRFSAATNLFQAVGGGWSPAPPLSASAASP
jgi:NodT family efflux transporter outer membrane factor (OMF) lipoprotein